MRLLTLVGVLTTLGGSSLLGQTAAATMPFVATAVTESGGEWSYQYILNGPAPGDRAAQWGVVRIDLSVGVRAPNFGVRGVVGRWLGSAYVENTTPTAVPHVSLSALEFPGEFLGVLYPDGTLSWQADQYAFGRVVRGPRAGQSRRGFRLRSSGVPSIRTLNVASATPIPRDDGATSQLQPVIRTGYVIAPGEIASAWSTVQLATQVRLGCEAGWITRCAALPRVIERLLREAPEMYTAAADPVAGELTQLLTNKVMVPSALHQQMFLSQVQAWRGRVPAGPPPRR
jgi:hypothetical protein